MGGRALASLYPEARDVAKYPPMHMAPLHNIALSEPKVKCAEVRKVKVDQTHSEMEWTNNGLECAVIREKEENKRKGDSSIETNKYAHMISGSMHEI